MPLAKNHSSSSAVYNALVEQGHLKEDELETLAAEELCENIFRLFSWTPGPFCFHEAATVPPGVQPVRIEVQPLLLEAARRCDEWSRLPSIYAQPETRFELMAEPKNDEKISLGLDEWKLLYLVSSCHQLGRIWQESPLASELETSRTLCGLASARMIRPLDVAEELEEQSEELIGFTGAILPPAGEPAGGMPVERAPDSLLDLDGTLANRQPAVVAVPKVPASEAPARKAEPPPLELPVDGTSGSAEKPPSGDDLSTVATHLPRRLSRSQICVERSGRLVVAVPVEDGRVFPLAVENATIGRAADNTVALRDAHVSAYHASISRDGDHYVIEDTGSSNGVRVNGKRCQRMYLRGGEEIEIFPFRLVFELDFEIFEPSGPVEVRIPS